MMPLALFGGHLQQWIGNYGYEAVFALVALESLGVPLPGETALITAALAAATTGRLNIAVIVVVAAGAAIIGDNIGFALGRWGGYRILRRYGRYVGVNERRLKIGRYVFLRYGGSVVFFGRFVAVLRTYAAFLAGVNRMAWPRCLLFNACGGVAWATTIGLASYYVGAIVTSFTNTIGVVLGVIAVLVVIGFLYSLRAAESRYAALAERAFPDPLEDH
jgi:membrane protein DedA with SNARE-associated domain